MSTDAFGFGFGGGGAATQDDATQGDGALVLDLENVQEAKFEVIPQGIYDAQVERCEFAESSNGNPMLTVVWRIMGGEYDKRAIWDFYTLNKAFGVSRLKTFLQRIVPEYPLAGFNPQKFADEGIAVARRGRIKLQIRPYQGEKRNNVKEVLEPGAQDGFGFGG